MKLLFKLTLILFIFLHLQSVPIYAAVTQDNDAGTYIDDLTNTSGINTLVGVGISSGQLQLKNSGGGYTAPFLTSGSFITNVVMPLSVTEWGTLDLASTIPDGTSINIQVLDNNNKVFSDQFLPGNSTGFINSTIDLSTLSILVNGDNEDSGGSKIARLKFKITLSTNNVSVTPQINQINFNWTVRKSGSEASPLSNTWSSQFADSRLTKHSNYYNPNKYYTFNWSSRISGITANSSLIMDSTKIYLGSWFGSKFSAVNKDNGSINWSIPYNPPFSGVITQNGTLINSEIWNDIIVAQDANNSGSVNWTYQFSGGHGNQHVSISNDGSQIYTVRSDDDSFTVYAFKYDGTLLWTKNINPDQKVGAREIAIGPNDNIFITTQIFNNSYESINQGVLYSLNPINGDILWQYSTGNVGYPIVGSDNTIYTFNSNLGDQASSAYIYAFNPDGSLKWKTSPLLNEAYGYGIATLDEVNNIIVAVRPDPLNSYKTIVSTFSLSDGALNWEKTYDLYYDSIMSDGNGNIIITASNWAGMYQMSIPGNTSMNVYDVNGNFLTGIVYSYQLLENSYQDYSFNTGPIIDDRGWLYGNLQKYYWDLNWEEDRQEEFTNPFALIPWTASLSVSPSTLKPGSDVTFTAQTSMLQQNPLFDTDNYMQVVLSNGSKIPLSYSHTQGDNTIWTATTKIPENFSSGSHTFTLEANAAHIQTDIPLHFDSPAPDSLNTGITAATQITIDNNTPQEDWQDSAGNSKKFRSLGDEFSRTTENLPEFSFIKAADSLTSIIRYQILLTNSDKKEWVYLDNIDPKKPLDKTYFEDDYRRIDYSGVDPNASAENNYDTIKIRSRKEGDKLKDGAYLWRVRAIDEAGNALDTTSKLIVINNQPAVFGDRTPFTLDSLNNLKLEITPFSKVKPITISKSSINLIGIANYLSKVKLIIKDKDGSKEYQTVTDVNSRYQLRVDNINYPTTLYLSLTDAHGNISFLPPITLKGATSLNLANTKPASLKANSISASSPQPTSAIQRVSDTVKKMVTPKIDEQSLQQTQKALDLIETIKSFFKNLFTRR